MDTNQHGGAGQADSAPQTQATASQCASTRVGWSEADRLVLFTRVLAVSVLLCLAFSWKLWLTRQHYPLVPWGDIVPPLPYPFDYGFLALLVCNLTAVVRNPASRIWQGLVVAQFAVLFLQDQSRLWPSFYQFFILFLLLLSRRTQSSHDDADRVLHGLRFVLAAIYFWSGVHKLNPHFFHEEFPWFVEPLTTRLPGEIPFLPSLGMFAALFEVTIGIGLLTNRFRQFALYDAMLMHLLIFFCIGPFRGHWNNSSWIWGLTTAAQAWVLFYRSPPFQFKTMFAAPRAYNVPAALAVLLVGMLPLLNSWNRWDSALSFNVYTGNVNYAEIHLRPEDVEHLPADIAAFVRVGAQRAVLDLNAWTLSEFQSNPYPETRIYRRVFQHVCSYLPEKSALLFVQEKASWFETKTMHRYGCVEK